MANVAKALNQDVAEIKRTNFAPLFSSASEEHETPPWLFNSLHKEFNFQLDAAASPENAKCGKYYTKKDNALNLPWAQFGSVWLNPPYGRKIGDWIKKAYEESKHDCTVVCLLPVRTDTVWWNNYIFEPAKHLPHDRFSIRTRSGVRVRWIKGRLSFGDSKNSAPFPSAIVIFGAYSL